MAYALYSAPLSSFKATPAPGIHSSNQKLSHINYFVNSSPAAKVFHVKAKAAKSDESTKRNSMVCSDCEGNGAVLCSQCKGSGVNSDDLFSGQFKAGDSCWLCGGRKEMLCGNCNGAGFLGGFMSTSDTTSE
ncbi:putative Heat shock protein DnaJ, cysteine-rich [Rosa chinensis]|uniref:Putative Heat shock protein DnaJ, cysteine-rich n=1 Tax=Rosa chinensis TaxID=74649 RepID=A0A2P6PXV8_ROSCH|nr:protein BUNDLE SHEATH DEFECTIVE 2, chloroplastic isoform X1 [Rosa chinensis]PRQ26754.1 putative Heat shock protein DnaJ, cysteine-rich [Rosa chinensis]